MSSTKRTGTYWEGSPLNLSESLLTRTITATKSLMNTFTDDLKDQVGQNKHEFDKTVAGIDLNQTKEILTKGQNDQTVENLDQLIDDQMKDITQDQYKTKLEEALKLQEKAAQFILTLKDKCKQSDQLNEELVKQNEKNNEVILTKLLEAKVAQTTAENDFNKDHANRLKMTEMVAVNPPPKFDSYKNFGTAVGMLAFLNEELEEYFDDMYVIDKSDKCRMIIKTFGDRSAEYKSTARRFFQQTATVELVNTENVTMRIIYKELVCYIFACRPRGDVGNRKSNESLTNFIERWFTVKEYCGISKHGQGASIIRKIFEKPEVLQSTDEIVREFKKEFFVKHANEESIGKGELLGFAQRLDMLYAGQNELGIKALESVQAINGQPKTGMVALEKNKDTEQIEKMMKQIEQLQMTSKPPGRSDNNNWRNNNNRPNYNNRQNNNNYTRRNYGNNGNGYNNRPYQNNNRNNFNNNDSRMCYHCGETGHIKAWCPQWKREREQITCYACGKQGHIQAHCPMANAHQNINSNTQQWVNKTPQQIQVDTRFKPGVKAFTVKPESMCVMGNQGDLREYIDTEIVPGTNEKSLLDTGASVDAICPKLLIECGISDQVVAAEARFIELADKSLVKIEGTIEMKVNVRGKEYQVKFVVMPGIKPNIIYGMPFLKATGILKDFQDAIKNRFSNTTDPAKN